jgi:hypothetical protein
MRTVSLLPAATDIVAALGGTDMLIGRTHECDWPLGALERHPQRRRHGRRRDRPRAAGSVPGCGELAYGRWCLRHELAEG